MALKTSTTRRSFLKVGVIGAVTLASAGGIYRLMRPVSLPEKFTLDGEAALALSSIIAVVLQGAAPANRKTVTQATDRVLAAIAGLPLTTQKEIQDLFALLSFGVTRRLLTGVPAQWQDAKPNDVAAFLQSWRTHRLALLKSAYAALHDLILGSWYADETTWASIGYPGPIQVLR
ncbi:hypothetical protein [Actimicrobium antarcticum]|uniref:Twin-arginine translocation signal domain-containing protein n=1 Tax=Actimicrobium antarcticum TaxID=1051899 RepID=A0ABP7T1G4_9BURK